MATAPAPWTALGFLLLGRFQRAHLQRRPAKASLRARLLPCRATLARSLKLAVPLLSTSGRPWPRVFLLRRPLDNSPHRTLSMVLPPDAIALVSLGAPRALSTAYPAVSDLADGSCCSCARLHLHGPGRRIAVRSGSMVGFGRGHGHATRDLGTPLWTPRRCPHVLDEKPEL
ncbi:hypothetical protein Zm00014a_015395 [Zea mays]|uniref:Uncharacterized protein n=2 Tax=Zea mays TaxID=4577 RepID=A0A804NSP0_MAIZE|nr:hypothetical protein Zm00014a_015395 [Zea mays]